MAKKLIILLLCLLSMGIGVIVGYRTANGTHTMRTENVASQKFYNHLVGMEKGECWTFNGFPYEIMQIRRVRPGETFLELRRNALTLVFTFPNQEDIVNRYPFYVFTDKKGNVWSLFQEGEIFRIYREDEKSEEYQTWRTFISNRD